MASLLADGVKASEIVAFTFTERAGAELKDRIGLRVATLLGPAHVDQLGTMFVGTIHAYSFQLLQRYVPRFEAFDVLDPNRLTALLLREEHRLGLRLLVPGDGLFECVKAFVDAVQIVENELLDPSLLPEPLRGIYLEYRATLDRYRLMTFGDQIARAIEELAKSEVGVKVRGDLRHLIVDKYQDVNPAQERLIELLSGEGGIELCVVGDDDQSIYQWRGSRVEDIVTFTERYAAVARYELLINRRGRTSLVALADQFAATIPNRLPEQMRAHREDGDLHPIDVSVCDFEADEAELIADTIAELAGQGVALRDIAILARKKVAFGAILAALEARRIPVQPGGRTALFGMPEADALGRLFAWLSDVDWKEGRYGARQAVTRADVIMSFTGAFELGEATVKSLGAHIDELKFRVPAGETVDLIALYYDLLGLVGVDRWDLTDPFVANRMGTLARFSAVIADFELVRRRARPDPDEPGSQVGGEFGGEWYFKNFAIFLTNYAGPTYEGFDGEPEVDFDAVDLLTVHGAKGLEWPVVFVPSVTYRRFDFAGNPQRGPSLVPAELYDAERYAGSDAEERRLFYVALTRARDWLSVSRHERIKKQKVASSRYFDFVQQATSGASGVPGLGAASHGEEDAVVRLTYSDLAAYLACGHSFRLRSNLGFMPMLAPELGYGKAVHHVMRGVADETMARGRDLTQAEAEAILQRDFYLAAANKPAHRQMKEAARSLLLTYLATPEYRAELLRTWETERPFELILPGMAVSGRADVIFSNGDDGRTRLSLVDYKTSAHHGDFALQLQIYANAGRREGLDVEAALVHDLKSAARLPIPIDEGSIVESEVALATAGGMLRARVFEPTKDAAICAHCDVRKLCRYRK